MTRRYRTQYVGEVRSTRGKKTYTIVLTKAEVDRAVKRRRRLWGK